MCVFSQHPGVDWLVGWVLFCLGDFIAPLALCGWEQQLLKDLAGERVAVHIFCQTACCCFFRCCLCGSTEESTWSSRPEVLTHSWETQAVLSSSIWLGCATTRRERFVSQHRKEYGNWKETTAFTVRYPHS